MRSLSRSLFLSLRPFALLLATACAADDGTPPPGDPDARAATDGGTVDNDAATTARITGVIRRSAMPQGDAIGNVFVAIFDRDPVSNMASAVVVGQALVTDVNLAAAGASVTYAVAGVPPRAEDYYMIAFLDDNGNVDASNPDGAGPDRGDLVSLNGVAAPKLTVATPGDHSHDIDLNLVMPF